ncbi:hypothetical protein [Chondromyces crocatus]|uniref:Polymerase/histidinol phosphatase N-terminal domain-containing protein n=1 Tax=Chondromyces crocatus TaxID=52 RepID=A0A0K1ES52_CHOCO|nr:hypothetical protein [Chondromyces crocatus]AKT43686.1 uncharacterized protein CMC5_079210 [Chondromyces crocatus]
MRSFPLLAAVLLLGCASNDAEAPTPPATPRAWERLGASSAALPEARGFRPFRGIIHSHSPYSHDACDDEGIDENGAINAACAADLRRGVCEAGVDFVFLTDHPSFMEEAPFEDLFFLREKDEAVRSPAGALAGNRLACDDGRRVLITVGHENALMSVGLERHVADDPEERRTLYRGSDAASADAMRAAGGLVIMPHTESHTSQQLAEAPVDAIEIFNLHASIDPDIREEWLGLDSFGAIAEILPFSKRGDDEPEPDLAFLGFFQELPRYFELWDEMLRVRRMPGTAGTDVHQNSFASSMRDNERGDSYRRLMRWFSNNMLLPVGSAEPDVWALKEALREGRSYVAFDILGIPSGFDFHAKSGSETVEMGGALPAGASIHVQAPTVLDPDPAVKAPEITMRLLRVTPTGTEVVGEGATIDVASASPGPHRVEVRIVPHHLAHYLGPAPANYVKTYLWLLSNPIYIE